MKEVMVPDEVQADPEAVRHIAFANQQLEEVLGNKAGDVAAYWQMDKATDGGLEYRVTLEGDGDRAVAAFRPREFESASDVRFRMSTLWRDLLRAQSARLFRQLDDLLRGGLE